MISDAVHLQELILLAQEQFRVLGIGPVQTGHLTTLANIRRAVQPDGLVRVSGTIAGDFKSLNTKLLN